MCGKSLEQVKIFALNGNKKVNIPYRHVVIGTMSVFGDQHKLEGCLLSLGVNTTTTREEQLVSQWLGTGSATGKATTLPIDVCKHLPSAAFHPKGERDFTGVMNYAGNNDVDLIMTWCCLDDK